MITDHCSAGIVMDYHPLLVTVGKIKGYAC